MGPALLSPRPSSSAPGGATSGKSEKHPVGVGESLQGLGVGGALKFAYITLTWGSTTHTQVRMKLNYRTTFDLFIVTSNLIHNV